MQDGTGQWNIQNLNAGVRDEAIKFERSDFDSTASEVGNKKKLKVIDQGSNCSKRKRGWRVD